jgi:hypothetical protein
MRFAYAAVAALVLSAACGKDANTNDTSQSKGPPARQFVLAVNTTGDGMVHGLTTDCRGACTQRYDAGTSVTLHAAADQGATFDGWSGACTGTGDCTLTVSSDMSVAAAFGHHPTPQHQLTVLVDGHGSVRSSPGGIDCGATCAATFDQGAVVTLTASPDSGWSLTGFSGACNGGSCSVTMSADALVRVKFDAIPPPPKVNLTVTVDGQGSVTGAGISCPGTCTTQVVGGTPVTLVARANTGARFMGFGGACTGATCSFAANADSSVSAKFEQEVITLAPADGTNLNSFAINSTRVFFQRYGNNVWGIWSVPKGGGDPSLVSQNYCCANSLAVDDSYVYWADWGTIWRAPVGGGAMQQVFNTANYITAFTIDAQNVYWTTDSFGGTNPPSGVFSGPLGGGAGVRLATGVHPTAIAVDAQFVYWSDHDASGTIMKVSKAGGTAATVIDCGSCVPVKVKLDFDNIYYRNNDGDTWMRPKAGGSFVQLNTGNPRSTSVYGIDLDVNAKVAYWTWIDYGSSPRNGLFKANADGTGWTAIETSSDTTWAGPRVDDNYIFYMHAGALYRRLK